MNKMILSALMATMMPLWANAQEPKSSTLPPITTDEKPFHNVDVSLTGGSTGIGFEVGTKVSNTVRLRAGLSSMPHFVHDMNFEVRVGDQPAKMYDKEAQPHRDEIRQAERPHGRSSPATMSTTNLSWRAVRSSGMPVLSST